MRISTVPASGRVRARSRNAAVQAPVCLCGNGARKRATGNLVVLAAKLGQKCEAVQCTPRRRRLRVAHRVPPCLQRSARVNDVAESHNSQRPTSRRRSTLEVLLTLVRDPGCSGPRCAEAESERREAELNRFVTENLALLTLLAAICPCSQLLSGCAPLCRACCAGHGGRHTRATPSMATDRRRANLCGQHQRWGPRTRRRRWCMRWRMR